MTTRSAPTAADWDRLMRRDCPSRTVIEVLADKWALYLLAALRQAGGPMRFGELRRRVDGITQKMLTQTLRSLERDGLVSRAVYPTVPPRVEYALTDLGVEAGRVISAVAEWSYAHIDEIHSARADFDERAALPVRPVRL